VSDLGAEVIEAPAQESGKAAASVRVHFVLPKGAYATTVLAGAVALDAARGVSDDDTELDETTTD
jgi:tRNA(Glu) U13 pseudouridine synthase TruD